MKTLKQLFSNNAVRYALFAAALMAAGTLAYPVGHAIGKQLYLLTH